MNTHAESEYQQLLDLFRTRPRQQMSARALTQNLMECAESQMLILKSQLGQGSVPQDQFLLPAVQQLLMQLEHLSHTLNPDHVVAQVDQLVTNVCNLYNCNEYALHHEFYNLTGMTPQDWCAGHYLYLCNQQQLQDSDIMIVPLSESAEYQGRKVELNKPRRGGSKKFYVYVRDPKTKNIKKVSFGSPDMEIKRDNPARRRNYRARHHCENPGPKTRANFWSCHMWSSKPVSKITKESQK